MKNKSKICYSDLICGLTIDKSFQLFNHLSFPGTERVTPLQMTIFLNKYNFWFFYKKMFNKKVTYTVFSELLLYLQFLKNNEPKIIHMPKRHTRILRGIFCCPSVGSLHISPVLPGKVPVHTCSPSFIANCASVYSQSFLVWMKNYIVTSL